MVDATHFPGFDHIEKNFPASLARDVLLHAYSAVKDDNPESMFFCGAFLAAAAEHNSHFYVGEKIMEGYEKELFCHRAATTLFLESADRFYPQAFARLGHIYYKGIGDVDPDWEKAAELYKYGYSLGDFNSGFNYSEMLKKGEGVDEDPHKAFEILHDLADNYKMPQAMNNLGFFYSNGVGTKQNVAKAKDYYRLAANYGVAEAAISLQRIARWNS